jgi:hypothetical protein
MLKDTLDYLHIDDLLLDPTLVIRLCELTPEMPYLLYGRAINPLALGGGMGPWLARHLEALFKLIDLYQENPELLTPAILEGRDIDDSTEALLYLTLDDEQTLKLVTYGIQTPGVGEGTLAWATRRAGNLSEGGRKVKLARRNNNSDGMSVS